MSAADALREEILAALTPGDDYPDPEGVATALCRSCKMPVVERRVRTQRQFTGPFWKTAWVHTDTGERRCWSPYASPDREVARD